MSPADAGSPIVGGGRGGCDLPALQLCGATAGKALGHWVSSGCLVRKPADCIPQRSSTQRAPSSRARQRQRDKGISRYTEAEAARRQGMDKVDVDKVGLDRREAASPHPGQIVRLAWASATTFKEPCRATSGTTTAGETGCSQQARHRPRACWSARRLASTRPVRLSTDGIERRPSATCMIERRSPTNWTC